MPVKNGRHSRKERRRCPQQAVALFQAIDDFSAAVLGQ
jgi:hypothetical protein